MNKTAIIAALKVKEISLFPDREEAFETAFMLAEQVIISPGPLISSSLTQLAALCREIISFCKYQSNNSFSQIREQRNYQIL